MTFRLIWPPRDLSPNARVHWSKRAKSAKLYRLHAKAAARAKQLVAIDGKVALHLHFAPPDRRHRDDDNLIAAFKSARDGIADALGVNDRQFVTVPEFGEPDPAGLGFVQVRLEAWAA